MKLVFVGASGGNRFMDEVLLAVEHAARAEGVETSFVHDAFPPDDDAVYVLVPHEFFACAPAEAHPGPRERARTIAFCVEQPGTQWFDLSAAHAASLAAVVDIQRNGVDELRRRGVAAEHFPFGYTDYWDRWGGDPRAERSTDVVFLGSANERRRRILAGYARTLWPRRTRILIPPEAPKTERRDDFYLGDEKWRLLASTKTLLNVHRQDSPYFEWVRVLETIANGCVVVSEHSADVEPLVPGEHYVSGRAESLALLADHLLDDPDRLRGISDAAYELVKTELPMTRSVSRLLDIAEDVLAGRRRRRRRPRAAVRFRARSLARRAARRAAWTTLQALRNDGVDGVLATHFETGKRVELLGAATKRIVLQQIETRRALARLERRLASGSNHEVETVHTTGAWQAATPRVTVGIPLYNHADEVVRALRSVAASEFSDLEIVVVDDASTDGSGPAVARFLEAHAWIPGRLLRHAVNRGLGRTRNTFLEHARGELVFALDADNEIYPTTLGRLVEALEADAEAVFAYSILEERTGDLPTGLRSAAPWDPSTLRTINYIDAMSLLRREAVLALGGYTEDVRMFGWEDFDLWCRVAENGLHGVFVPEILCRYHCSPTSMLSITDIDTSEAWSLLRLRYPALMGSAP